ncbi:MAG: cob(I)yrinic acid a,c-diamide adenosyltransferase [Sphaerochaeta sp.]|jgi:cob(I)alamin adenosyltransferase
MGLILIYTGDGKGKSSAGFGQAIRALGHGGRVKVAQFIKQGPPALTSGEHTVLTSLGVEWVNWGAGFTWIEGNDEKNRLLAREGWQQLKEWIEGGQCDLIVADEFTYTLNFGYLDLSEVVSYLSEQRKKPTFPHFVITGRSAAEELIAIADMVSSVEMVKHHLYDNNQEFQAMIEF